MMLIHDGDWWWLMMMMIIDDVMTIRMLFHPPGMYLVPSLRKPSIPERYSTVTTTMSSLNISHYFFSFYHIIFVKVISVQIFESWFPHNELSSKIWSATLSLKASKKDDHRSQRLVNLVHVVMMVMMIYILWWVSVCLSVCHEKWSLPPESLL